MTLDPHLINELDLELVGLVWSVGRDLPPQSGLQVLN